MEGEVRHFIGGTLVEEPGGSLEFKEEIERDLENRIIYPKYPNSLQFIGDGYAILREAYEQGYCTSFAHRCEIDCGGWRLASEGTIYLTDISWNLSKCIADTPVTDTTVGATILNNKEIPCYPTSDKTKNGLDMTPVTAIDLEVFDPQAAVGVYIATTRKAYDWLECMDHLVRFITDGNVTVVSDWYDALPDEERYAMVSGVHLRTAGTNDRAPAFNFKDLYEGLWKPYNLMAGLEKTSTGSPVIRIEQDSYWYGNQGAITFMNTEDLIQEINTDRMYAKIKMGSLNAIKNEAQEPEFSLPYVGLRTFCKEEYHIEGQCNTNNTLDLTNQFVLCSNAIEAAVVDDDEKNDEEVFMIQYDRGTSQAVKDDYLTNAGVPYLYNVKVLNQEIINRWSLQASGASYFDEVDAAFLAEYTVGPTVVYTHSETYPTLLNPFTGADLVNTYWQFDNDYTAPNYDTGNNYGNGTAPGSPVSLANSRYTAPTQGLYVFNIGITYAITINNNTGTDAGCRWGIQPWAYVEQYDATNVLLNTYTLDWNDYPWNFQPGNYDHSAPVGIYLQAGEYVRVKIRLQVQYNLLFPTETSQGVWACNASPANFPPVTTIEARVLRGTRFSTQYVASFGGLINDVDPDLYYVALLKFSRHIDTDTWEDLRDNYTQGIGVGALADDLRRGYIRNASRVVSSGATEWELIANRTGKI